MTGEGQSVDENLSPDECWSLLGTSGIGRLATVITDPATGAVTPDIYPINYLVHEGSIVFKSAPGSKLIEMAGHSAVALEADGARGAHGEEYWSVVVHGHAARMLVDEEIEASGILALLASHPSDKWNYLRITVDVITGIRFIRA